MGLYYKPNLEYKLKELKPARLKEEALSGKFFLKKEKLIKTNKAVEGHIDYLIYLCEQNLSNKDNFNNYKELAIKHYYCNKPLTNEESDIFNTFEQSASSIEGGPAIDIYPVALTLKKEIEDNTQETNFYIKTQDSSLKFLSQKIDKLIDNFFSEIKEVVSYGSELKKEHDDKLEKINSQVNKLEKIQKDLKKEYKKAIEAGNQKRALLLQEKLKSIEKNIDDIKTDVSFLASTTHLYFNKAKQADDYAQKMAYTLLASPMDKLDQTICCLLKLFIQQLDIDLNIPEIDERFYKKLNREELLKAIESIKSIINVVFLHDQQRVNKVLKKMRNFLMSPVRKVISEIMTIISEYKIKAISNIENFFEVILTSDYENPSNVLDCIHFEGFADFIYESMEEIDQELRDRIIDYYKFIYKTTDFLAEDAVKVQKKEKIREVNRILDLLIITIESIEDFTDRLDTDELSLRRGLEEWLEAILIRNGYGTTYNSQTGRYERISLEGCLDSGQDTGSFQNYFDEDYDDLPEIRFEKNRDYQNFIEDHKPYNYSCNFKKGEN